MKIAITNISKFFVLGIFLLASISVQSQPPKKIFGNVYDKENDSFLIGATLHINTTNFSTSTNEFGYFEFENLLAGIYEINVSYLGYKTETISNIEIQKDFATALNIYLEKEPIKLSEVIVSTLGEKDFTENSLIKFSRKDIEQSNFQSVGEILSTAPGINITETGSTGSLQKISIRGSENNQVLVLLDGVSINNHFGGEADLSQIPTNIIESIEVRQGGNSSLFGNGAIGGVVNIITRKNFEAETKLKLSTGSFGLVKVEPTFSGNFNDLSYLISYTFNKSSGNYSYFYQNTSGNKTNSTRFNSDFISHNAFARINYKFKNNIFTLSAQKSFSERGLPGMTNALTGFARSKVNNNSVNAGLKSSFDSIVLDINYSFANTNSANTNLYTSNSPTKYSRYPQYNYEYETNTSVLNSTIFFKPLNWLYIRAGYNGKLLNYSDYNMLSNKSNKSSSAQDISNGIYIQKEVHLDFPQSDFKFIISPSLRYDNIKMTDDDFLRTENQWSPSLSTYFALGDKSLIYVKPSISSAFRAPTFSDLFFQDVRIEGKPDLLPEQSFNREISLGLNFNFEGRIKTEFTYYKNTVDNMIIWKLGSFEVFKPFNNNAEITGQTYSLSYQSSKRKVNFNINYTHLLPLDKNSQETTRNKIIPYHSQHSLKLNVQYEFESFITNIHYRLFGKRFVTVANTVELAPYNVLDVSFQQNLSIGDINSSLIFTINNLTNEQYELARNYPMPGREFRLGLTLTY